MAALGFGWDGRRPPGAEDIGRTVIGVSAIDGPMEPLVDRNQRRLPALAQGSGPPLSVCTLRVGCVAIGTDLRGAAPGSWGLASSVRALHPPLWSGCDLQCGFAGPLDVTKSNPSSALSPANRQMLTLQPATKSKRKIMKTLCESLSCVQNALQRRCGRQRRNYFPLTTNRCVPCPQH